MKKIKLLGRFLLSIVLFFVYILYVLPAALLFRYSDKYAYIFNKKRKATYFMNRKLTFKPKDLERL